MYSSASHPSSMRQSSTGSLGSYGGESSSSSSLGLGGPALSQQHFNSSYAVDYSSPIQQSRSMHGDGGGSGSRSGGGGGGGNYNSASYAPAPSGSSGAGMKYAQQPQQQQSGPSNASMAPRAPGGSSYSSSGLSNANGSGGGGRDLTPISHPGMHRSTQPQQQQRYSNSSSSYQALPSSYNGNVGPIGSLPSSSSSNVLSDPWSDTSSPLGGISSSNSYAQYPAMAGSAQSLMPLPPHPSAVPPAKGGGGAGAGKKAAAATAAAHSTVPGGAAFLPSAAAPADPPEPELPKPPRVDLSVRKQTLDALLGDAATANTYWNLVEKYLLVKLSKSELDAFVLEKLGRKNLHVHNDFFLAVLQNALSDDLPPKPARKKGEPRKPRVKSELTGATAKAGKKAGADAALKKERKPRSDKKKHAAGALAADGKKSKRKSRSSGGDDELLTSVASYLSSPHLHAGSAHKPMAHLLRPAQYFDALENLKRPTNAAAGATAMEYGQGGSFEAGAADLSGAWANSPRQPQQPTPVGFPPVDGHLQAPRRVYSASNSVSIEYAQQTMAALFKPRPAPHRAQQPHPHTSQLMPRAKSVSPRSSIMQDDSAAASSAAASTTSSGPSSLHASSSPNALSTVMHTPSSASPSRLVRDVLPLSFTSEYTAHWDQAAAARKSFQTALRSDPNSMDDDESSPSVAAAAAGLDSDLNGADDDDADADGDDEELPDESDPYARLGDPETRAYLSALHSHPVPDRDVVRKRLYTSALHSGVPNVSEAAVSMLQAATEQHLRSIIASIVEYARPDKRGSMVRVLEQNTVGAVEAESMEEQSAAAAANGAESGAAAALSVTPPSANAAAVVPMDESAQRSTEAPAAADEAVSTDAAPPTVPAAANLSGIVALPLLTEPASMQDTNASMASTAASSSSAAAPAAAATTAAALTTATASTAMELSHSMTPAQRIAYVRDAISGPHSDPLLLPPLVHNTWASVNAHMPVDRSDSPLPSLRVDAPMRMPLSAAQLTAAMHQYPELLSPATAPLILERLSACQ